tara:strand:+ start:188 stop:352 length:165 start_codon:yes stop_codon:yes gene_type:complete
MKNYRVEYQNAFGTPRKEHKTFNDLSEAKWFERAMKRSNFITWFYEDELSEGHS